MNKKLATLLTIVVSFTLLQNAYGISYCPNGLASDFSLRWQTLAHLWETPSYLECSHFAYEGTARFNLNNFPLTYCERTNRLYSCSYCTTWPDECPKNICAGEIIVASCEYDAGIAASLLRIGSNTINFDTNYLYNYEALQYHIDYDITLKLDGQQNLSKEIYKNKWSGPQCVSCSFEITWDDYNPFLASKLNDLISNINKIKKDLEEKANESQLSRARLARLNELEKALNAILDQGSDAINPTSIGDILSQYFEFPELGKKILDVVKDLWASLDTLKRDIQDVVDEFSKKINGMASDLTRVASETDFDISDSSNYQQPDKASDQPPISIPDLPNDNPFDKTNDYYDKYADDIIAQLQLRTDGSIVRDRQGFLDIVLIWKQDQQIIQKNLQLQAYVCKDEYAAFLNAQQKVLNYILTYMDENLWYKDNILTSDMRQFIDDWGWPREDGPKYPYNVTGKLFKQAFLMWYGDLSPQDQIIVSMMPGIRAYVQNVAKMVAFEDPELSAEIELASAKFLPGYLGIISRAGVGFTPFVNDIMDWCEFAVGIEMCSAGGKDLSIFERSLSGLGMIVGSGVWWRSFSDAPELTLKLVARETSEISTELALFRGVFHPAKLPAVRSLDIITTRDWYILHVLEIGDNLNKTLPLRQQAVQAFMLRNEIRDVARTLMKDVQIVTELPAKKSFIYFTRKYYQQGYTGDSLWQAIIDSSMRTNKDVNAFIADMRGGL